MRKAAGRVDRVWTTLPALLHQMKTRVSAYLVDWYARLVHLRTRQGRQGAWRAVLPVIGFATGYLAAYLYGNGLPSPAPFWPPDGVLLAALLLTPVRRWWLYLLVTIPIRLLPAFAPGIPIWLLLVNLLNDTLKALLAAVLVRYFVPLPLRFTSLRATGIYLATAVLLAPFLSALLGAAGRAALGTPYSLAWRTWLLGDALASLVLTPTIILWVTAGVAGLRPASRQRALEALLLAAALLVVAGLSLGHLAQAMGLDSPLLYLPVPLLIWAAVRFGLRGTATMLTLVTAFAVASVAGRWDLILPGPQAQAVLSLQLFLIVTAVPLLLLAAQIEERKQTDVALRASEARFRAAFASAVTGMMLVSTDGHPLQVNRPLVEMLGYSEEELRLRTFADFTHPDDVEPNLTLFRRAVAGELDSYQVEKRFVHKQGHVVWGRVSVGVVRDAASQALYLVGQVEDITERKQLEQEREAALAASEAWFHSLADTAPVLVWVSGPDGLVTFVNLPWLQFTGRTMEQEVGNGWVEGVHPDDYDYCLQTYLTAFQAREHFSMEYRLRRVDGEYRWLVDTGTPRFAPDGTFAGYIGSAIDISERRQLEQEREAARAEAKRQAEELDRVFETMADAVIVYDAQGRTLRTNRAAHQLLGLGAAPPNYYELPGHDRISLLMTRDADGHPLPPDELPSTRALRGQVLTGASAVDIKSRSFDGREMDLNVSAAPLRDAGGRIIGAVTIMRDQTERKRLEREREDARANELALREVNERLDTFVTMAAHDLRSPVGVSRMALERAQEMLTLAAAGVPHENGKQTRAFARAAQALALTEESLNRLWRLVQQLLDASRVKKGMLVLQRQPVQLEAVVRACVDEQRQLNPSRVITLDLPGPAEAPANAPTGAGARAIVVDADADRLGQVLTNYLTNAQRYSAEDQPIEVCLRLVDEESADVSEEATPDGGQDGGKAIVRQAARVEVRDHGVGIAQQDQATIWHRFQRARSVHETSGLGLGLYIARTIVELHGGQIGVESTVGQGSTFWFTLPLALAAESSPVLHGGAGGIGGTGDDGDEGNDGNDGNARDTAEVF